MEADIMSMLTSAGLAHGGAPRPLDGKVALITASTAGRGLVIAAGLAAQGAMIALVGPGDPDTVRGLCQALGAGCDVPVLHDDADMSDAAALMDMVERIERALGAVDILVNQGDQRFTGIPTQDAAEDPMRGLTMYFHATAAVLPGMRRRGFGRIVNIAPEPFQTELVGHDRDIRTTLARLIDATARQIPAPGITCHALFLEPDPRDQSTSSATMPPSALANLISVLCGNVASAEPGMTWITCGAAPSPARS